jgi:dnaG: DNA primase
MVIDKTLIEDIKSSTNIVDVIGEVVSLNRAGRNYLGLCPFHKEKLPHLTLLRIGSFTIALVVASLAMSSNF